METLSLNANLVIQASSHSQTCMLEVSCSER
jgi:hypothetical protein